MAALGGRVSALGLVALLAACAKPPEAPLAPEVHGWKEEGDLVVSGLGEVKGLWKQGQREAARKLAEQVYTDRWEPRLERAARSVDPDAARQTEYAFGLLLVELEARGGRDRVEERIRTVDERVEAATRSAEKAFPPLGQEGAPVEVIGDAQSHPVVPPVAPAWDAPAEPP